MYKIIYENGTPVLKSIILTKEETIRLHRDMWRWIADQMKYYSNSSEVVSLLKSKYLYGEGYVDVYLNCFCCEYKFQQGIGDCQYICPFNWSDGDEFVGCMCGYYGNLRSCSDDDKGDADDLALKIANMPVREGYI